MYTIKIEKHTPKYRNAYYTARPYGEDTTIGVGKTEDAAIGNLFLNIPALLGNLLKHNFKTLDIIIDRD